MYVRTNRVVFPVFRFIVLRNGCQLCRSNEGVDGEGEGAEGDDAQHEVEVQHVLELVPLPTRGCDVHGPRPTSHATPHCNTREGMVGEGEVRL